MENERISKAFETLVKNAGTLLQVRFADERQRTDKDKKGVFKYNGVIVWVIDENDTDEQLAENLIKAEELVDKAEKERIAKIAYDKAHPELFRRLQSIYQYEGKGGYC